MATTLRTIPTFPLRVVAAGSSITWGGGFLDNSYVASIGMYLRTQLAQTVHASEMNGSGRIETIRNPLFWQGHACRLYGAGAQLETMLDGDEITICYAVERGNRDAAVIALYVDDVLHEEAVLYNNRPYAEHATAHWTGDGQTVKFVLPVSCTWDAQIEVDGAAQRVGYNTQGYGASFPADTDVLIIRQVEQTESGPRVVHACSFREAPAAGSRIAVTYHHGEHLIYARTSIGSVGRGFDSPLESPYGDGNIDYDPACPAALSSGLDFRYSDEEACLTWRFHTSCSRRVRIVLLDRHPQSTGEEPCCTVNFVTNRAHQYMNAGIGGYTAASFLEENGLRTYRQIQAFRPDLLVLESCTNDDRRVHQWKASRRLEHLTRAQMKQLESALFVHQVEGEGDDYTIEWADVTIRAATSDRVTFDTAQTSFGAIGPDDLVLIGSFRGDNTNITARVVTHWDAATHTATLEHPLSFDATGCTAHVKGVDVGPFAWVRAVETLIRKFRATNPAVHIGIATSGPPNYWHRTLEGYRELGCRLARRNGCDFVDFYGGVARWQQEQREQQEREPVYIGPNCSITSTGAAQYRLLTAAGEHVQGRLLRGWSVRVNGVERYGDCCTVIGGWRFSWEDTAKTFTMANRAMVLWPYTVTFTERIPSAGDTIEIGYVRLRWAEDDCHPGPIGASLFGQEAVAFVQKNAFACE